MGIEPTYSAWKAEVLPLNYTRYSTNLPDRHGLAAFYRATLIDTRLTTRSGNSQAPKTQTIFACPRT